MESPERYRNGHSDLPNDGKAVRLISVIREGNRPRHIDFLMQDQNYFTRVDLVKLAIGRAKIRTSRGRYAILVEEDHPIAEGDIWFSKDENRVRRRQTYIHEDLWEEYRWAL